MTGFGRVMNRTLIYGVLAVAIGAAYVYGVSHVDTWLGMDTDWLAPPQVAAAGLVAVVFHPVRVGLEWLADRVIYGRRLRPATAVARIAALGRSTGADADALRELARIIATGLGTESAAVRLNLSDGARAGYAWPDGGEWDEAAVPGQVTAWPVTYQGEAVGAIELPTGRGRSPAPRRRALRERLVASAGVLLHNARLNIELELQVRVAEARAAEIRASRWRIVAAQGSERRELERNLHDGAQPGLTAVRLTLGLVTHLAKAGGGKEPTARKALDDLVVQAESALAGLRQILRGLGHEVLRQSGLAPALAELAEDIGIAGVTRIEDRTCGLRVRADLEAAAYLCCAEAMQNAAKHSPDAKVTLRLEHNAQAETLVFSVSDEGPGFDIAAHAGAVSGGLQNMADRAAAVGGTVTISSTPHGTVVCGSIPAARVLPIATAPGRAHAAAGPL
jgi:signal transduction histidine kinase